MAEVGCTRGPRRDRQDTAKHAWIALVSILLLAGALRLTGLSWGLRHVPHFDERFVVENVWNMQTRGDLDHRFYLYPGLLYILLYPFIGLVHQEGPATPEAYLVARGVVALISLANVGLVYALGRRLSCWRLGLGAALFLAVSPVDVHTAHAVRTGIALQSAVLLGLLSFLRLGKSVVGDLRAGLAIGAAGAIKFTGAFLVPSYLAARWLAPGPKLTRVGLTGFVAIAVFVAATPYSVINYREYVTGIQAQLVAQYGQDPFAASFLEHLAYYLQNVVFALGPLGAILAIIGVFLGCREWRQWLPLLLHVLTTLVIMSTGGGRFLRFLVPTSALLCLLAALPLARLGTVRPRLAVAVAVLAAAIPLNASAVASRAFAQPSTPDRALDWIEERAPDNAVILDGFVGLQELGLDRRRYDVLKATGSPERDRRLAVDSDFVITDPDAAFVADWGPSHVVEPESEFSGPPIALRRVPAEARRRYAPVELEPDGLDSSENPGVLVKMLDGRPRTQWNTARDQRAGDWIEVRFERPTPVARIEMDMGPWSQRFARELELLSRKNGEDWQRREALDGRPSTSELIRWQKPVSQVLLIEPVPVSAVRIVAMRSAERKWGISELRILVLSQGSPSSAVEPSDEAARE